MEPNLEFYKKARGILGLALLAEVSWTAEHDPHIPGCTMRQCLLMTH